MAANERIADTRDCFNLVGTELASKYVIDRVVAVGGFGVVYAGHDQRLRVPVAVKVMRPLDGLTEVERQEFAAQFVREAQTVARMRHPNIVRVHDVGVARMPSGIMAPWTALEWLEGHTLQVELHARSKWSERRGMLPAEALSLLRPAIDAVAYAHEEGFAHRDLKPANILLVPNRRVVSAQVLDFGVAKAVRPGEGAGSGQTETRSVVAGFSPTYAAPEQIASTRTGPWTDVHALGLMLTELVVGRHPYESRDQAILFARALAETRPTPARLGVDVGPLEPVLGRALAFRPDERYTNAREMLDALDAALGPVSSFLVSHLATEAPPPPVVDMILAESGRRERPSQLSPPPTPPEDVSDPPPDVSPPAFAPDDPLLASAPDVTRPAPRLIAWATLGLAAALLLGGLGWWRAHDARPATSVKTDRVGLGASAPSTLPGASLEGPGGPERPVVTEDVPAPSALVTPDAGPAETGLAALPDAGRGRRRRLVPTPERAPVQVATSAGMLPARDAGAVVVAPPPDITTPALGMDNARGN